MFYVVALSLAFLAGWIALAIYAIVAVIGLVPDRRIEKTPAGRDERSSGATAGRADP